MTQIDIAGHKIGPGHPCFIIGEAGVNHNGDLDLAMEMIDVAATCGANTIKFQAFKAENLASRFAPKAEYQHQTTDDSESHVGMLRKLELPHVAYPNLDDIFTGCMEGASAAAVMVRP